MKTCFGALRWALPKVLSLIALAGCGIERPLILISVTHVTSDITTLVAGVQTEKIDARPISVSASSPTFGIWLPNAATGTAAIAVAGWDSTACTIAEGGAIISITAPAVQEVTIGLTRVPRRCP